MPNLIWGLTGPFGSIRPFMISFAVPSPPTHMMVSAPERADSRASWVASPGFVVNRLMKGPKWALSRFSMEGQSRPVDPLAALGFTIQAMCFDMTVTLQTVLG